jgi:hypothetical protein
MTLKQYFYLGQKSKYQFSYLDCTDIIIDPSKYITMVVNSKATQYLFKIIFIHQIIWAF